MKGEAYGWITQINALKALLITKPARKLLKRRLYFPAYDKTFPLWMRDRLLCGHFIRVFADLMTNGDDPYLISQLLNDNKLTEDMRSVVNIFNMIINEAMEKRILREKDFDLKLDSILREDAFNMNTIQLLKQEGRLEGLREGRKEMALDMLNDNKPDDEILKYSRITIELWRN